VSVASQWYIEPLNLFRKCIHIALIRTAEAAMTALDQQRVKNKSHRNCLATAVLGCMTLSVSAEGTGSGANSGAKEFQRNCASCHFAALTFTPAINKYLVNGREDAVRKLILEGGVNMPGFKYILNEQQTNAIIAYMKTLDTPPKTITNDRVDP
jgi:mono/diheme cytochrome c family protein